MKTVLAPIDFSPISDRVIEQSIAIARAIDGRLVLLYVVQPPAVLAGDGTNTDVTANYWRHADDEAAVRLSNLQHVLRARGVTAHAIHQVGEPGARILEQADRLEADYIVVGSHGHGSLYELIVGSTTSRILRKSACPIVVVPAHDLSAAPSELRTVAHAHAPAV